MELERFYDTVLRLINDRKKAAAANADAWFEYIADYSKRDSYRLAQLKFGSVNLEQIWRASYEPAVKEWKSRKQDWIRTRDRYQIERAERFLLGHPAAESKEDEFRKYFSGIEYRGVSDHLRGFQAIISSKIEQQVTFYDRHQD